MGLRPWQRLHHASPAAQCSSSPSTSSSTHSHIRSEHGAQLTQRTKGIRLSGSKVMLHTKSVISKQAKRLAKKADEHEQLITKVTYSLGVLAFGIFCYILGARPHDIPYLYVGFFIVAAPLRWVYYRAKKWHYFLLDFCYYANLICIFYLLFFSKSEKLFLLCFAFSEGPLAWALIVWRCSLVFSSVDKLVSVLIHLLPGTVVFIIRWWDPITFTQHPDPVEDGTFGPWPAWPQVESTSNLWVWMFVVPLGVYVFWQLVYFAVVHGLRNQRILGDPEVLTSFRELARKASRANNFWWKLSGALGEDRRFLMYALLQAVFTVLTMALTVPMFMSYRLHMAFQFLKIMTSIWNGGNFFLEVMPRQMHAKAAAKKQQREQQTASPHKAQQGTTNTVTARTMKPDSLEQEEGDGSGSNPKLSCFERGTYERPTQEPSQRKLEEEEQESGAGRMRNFSSLALEARGEAVSLEASLSRPGIHCRTCGQHQPWIELTKGEDENEDFLPASSEPLWMDGMSSSSWDSGEKERRLLGHGRSSSGSAGDGLEMERSIWSQGTPGSVACMG